MIVQSDVLGPLQVAEDAVLRFPAGLVGFPESRSFVLVPAERKGFFWLQSATTSGLVFVVVDPFLYFDGYAVDVPPPVLAELEGTEGSAVVVLSIVTLPASREARPTANLQGPLVVNLDARLGRQIILQDERFGVRCELDLSRAAD